MKVSVVLKCVNKAKLVNVADMHVHGDLVADIVHTLCRLSWWSVCGESWCWEGGGWFGDEMNSGMGEGGKS